MRTRMDWKEMNENKGTCKLLSQYYLERKQNAFMWYFPTHHRRPLLKEAYISTLLKNTIAKTYFIVKMKMPRITCITSFPFKMKQLIKAHVNWMLILKKRKESDDEKSGVNITLLGFVFVVNMINKEWEESYWWKVHNETRLFILPVSMTQPELLESVLLSYHFPSAG